MPTTMGTSPQDNGILAGSPVSIQNHSQSPVRRRSTDSTNPDDPTRGAAASLARHSPTLVRSFNPNDPDVRERQRTMDVDMAMQLSRARRVTNASTTSPFETHPPSMHHQIQQRQDHSPEREMFPATLDEEEELQMHYQNNMNDRHELDINDPVHDGDTVVPRRTRSDPSLHHGTPTHAGTMADPLGPYPTSATSGYGPPTYQPGTSRSNFDFSRMEEFAAVEKANRGIGSPAVTRFAPDRFLRRPSPAANVPGDQVDQRQAAIEDLIPDLGEGSSSTSQIRLSSEEPMQPEIQNDDGASEHLQRPVRHRKISQSTSARPRPPRKGIGGKISLFESAPTEPVPRLPPLSTNLAATSGLNPYSDFVITATGGQNTGILNPTTPGQGHDRPYRFSFYSNFLSATIHARSLSELPAEGQSFEDLFAGQQPPAPPPPFQASTSNGHHGNDHHLGSVPKSRPASSLAFTPPPQAPPGYLGHKLAPSDNASVYAGSAPRPGNADRAAGETVTPPQQDTDNTWWLDVMCPTDEEMKMLSKVCFHINLWELKLCTKS